MGETLHVGITILHMVVAVFALVMSIIILVFTLGGNGNCTVDSCQPMLFITSTFLSSRRTESNVGWPVVTERTSFNDPLKQYPLIDTTNKLGYAFTHYYECMFEAKMASVACGSNDNLSSFYTCVTTNAGTLPGLTTCNVLPSANSAVQSHFMTSEEYITCIDNVPALRNAISTRASKNVFRACLAKSQWPFVEYQLDLDTPVFLGSYNWGLFLVVGLAVMTSFGVYSISWKEDGPVSKGEPEYFKRLGLFWAWTAWLWNLGFLVVFLLIAFRESGNFEANGGLPTTVSTTLVTLGLLGFALVYFGNELFVPGQWQFLSHVYEGSGVHKIVKHYHHHTAASVEHVPLMDLSGSLSSGKGELGLPMPGPSREYMVTDALVSKYYTPPLLSTWADAYIADAVIFLGVAGATQQVTTEFAWNLFVLIGCYRLLNSMIARFMYECFMNNFSLEDEVNAKKFTIKPAFTQSESNHKDPHLSSRVMALSTQIGAIYLYIAIVYLAFNGNIPLSDFKTFKDFTICCFVVPEALRILLHLYCQFYNNMSKTSSWLILNTSMFIWTWDLLCRTILISIIFLQGDSSYMGTREYLVRMTNTLLRDYITALV
jgi:hypothetical protein